MGHWVGGGDREGGKRKLAPAASEEMILGRNKGGVVGEGVS